MIKRKELLEDSAVATKIKPIRASHCWITRLKGHNPITMLTDALLNYMTLTRLILQ